jgi:hypothetical protein
VKLEDARPSLFHRPQRCRVEADRSGCYQPLVLVVDRAQPIFELY